MPHTQFDKVQLGAGKVHVGGPFEFGPTEPLTSVRAVQFVIVQDDVVVEGIGEFDGQDRWDGEELPGNLAAGKTAQAFGMAAMVRRPGAPKPPSVETLTWSEVVDVT